MKHMPVLTEVMAAFPLHVSEETDLPEAFQMMSKHSVSHLPVLSEGKVVGLLSTAGINLAKTLGHDVDDTEGLTVGDICNRQFISVELHTRLDVALETMAKEHVSAIVVLKSGKLAGILSTKEVCAHYAKDLKDRFLPDDDPSVA